MSFQKNNKKSETKFFYRKMGRFIVLATIWLQKQQHIQQQQQQQQLQQILPLIGHSEIVSRILIFL